jgi:hypothetical protein
MVEHAPLNPNIKGSNLTTDYGRDIRAKKTNQPGPNVKKNCP